MIRTDEGSECLMEYFKTFVNTSENINPVVSVEFTKLIYGFDLSLVKRFTVCCFPFVREYRKLSETCFGLEIL